MVMDCTKIIKNNLYIENVNTQDLVKTYGTPLYVFSENSIRNNINKYKKSIDTYYNGYGKVVYASKAFSCKEIYRIAKSENISADCVSMGEIYTAISAGFNAENIIFHGNNKTEEELIFALDKGVGRIVIDNFEEIEFLDSLAKEKNIKVNVLLRITPGVDAHTHEYIKTGKIDSKFGFAIATGDAKAAVKSVLNKQNLNLYGLHSHIGSQIFDTEPFVHAADVMLKFIKEIKEATSFEIKELNLGGGFGVKYTNEDDPVDYEDFMKAVSSQINLSCNKYNIKIPFIYIEPGRSIVAPAGLTLYTVGSVKEIKDIKNYVAVDGGMSDNPRYALYNAKYTMLIANKAENPQVYKANIAGKCCESGDLLAENIMIQIPAKGDILAVLSTGAYNYSMSSNYNRIPRPAVVLVNENSHRLIVKRETYEDIISNDF